MSEIKEYSQEEKIELFKENLNQLVAYTDLSISVLYYVLKDYTNEVENLYEQYRSKVVESLNKKMAKDIDSQDGEKIEEELKAESPEFKVSVKESK